jgi:hypothetical protein
MHPIQIICPASPIKAISCLHQIQAVLWTKLRNIHLVLTSQEKKIGPSFSPGLTKITSATFCLINRWFYPSAQLTQLNLH